MLILVLLFFIFGAMYNSNLTDRFHVAMRLLSNTLQMASKHSKNEKLAHEPLRGYVTDVLITS